VLEVGIGIYARGRSGRSPGQRRPRGSQSLSVNCVPPVVSAGGRNTVSQHCALSVRNNWTVTREALCDGQRRLRQAAALAPQRELRRPRAPP
jgi:hypothetical protein